MAIIIPPKNIYEITNQKVIDNEVDNVEVGVKSVVHSDKYYTPVYNESFDVKENTSTSNTGSSDKTDKDYLGSGGGYHSYIRLASASQIALTYKTIPEIWIKKLRGKDIISQIYYKTDDQGNTNIKYNLTAKIQIANNFGISYDPSTNTFNFYENVAPIEEEKNAYSYTSIDFSGTNSESVNITSSLTATLQTELSAKVEENKIITRAHIQGIGSPPFDSVNKNFATSEISLPVREILSFNNIEEIVENGEEYYVIKGIKICVGALCKLGYAYIISPTPMNELGEVGGQYIKGAIIKLVPSSVQVTIYGDTIGIDLQNETVKIGDGQHIYSFNGNELTQTSNTPSVKYTYAKIARYWCVGKETAKIRCSIDDYYEETGEIAISPSSLSLPMMFHVGDLVIPYIRSARLGDVPMSILPNYPPSYQIKEFLVIATHLIYDGQPLQEITIIENQKKLFIEIEITYINEPFSPSTSSNYQAEIVCKYGIMRAGDTIRYETTTNERETANVYWVDDYGGYFAIDIRWRGAFYNNAHKPIWVEVLSFGEEQND